MATETPIWLTVDRLEGSVAVLLSDEGEAFDVDRSALPTEAREGSVLLVPRDRSGFS